MDAGAVPDQESTGLLSRDASNPNITQQIGQSSTGLELAFAVEPVRGWTIDANAALLRARYDDYQELVSGQLVSRSGNTPTGVPERVQRLERLAPGAAVAPGPGPAPWASARQHR